MTYIKFFLAFLFGFLLMFDGTIYGKSYIKFKSPKKLAVEKRVKFEDFKNYRDWFRTIYPYSSFSYRKIPIERYSVSDFQRVIDTIQSKKIENSDGTIKRKQNIFYIRGRENYFLARTLYAYFEKNPTSNRYKSFKQILYNPLFVQKMFLGETPKENEGFKEYVFRQPDIVAFLALNGLFSNDKEAMLSTFRRIPIVYNFIADSLTYNIGEDLKKDKSFALEAVSLNRRIFRVLDSDLRNDREVFLKAAKYGSIGLFSKHDSSLKEDKELVLIAVKISASYLKYLDSRFLKDREVVLSAFKEVGVSGRPGGHLRYVNENLRADKEIALKAVYSDGDNLEFVSDELKDDPEVVISALKSPQRDIISNHMWTATPEKRIKFASDRLKNDKSFALKVIKFRSRIFEYLGDSLKDDFDVVFLAIEKRPYMFVHASERLRDNKEIAYKAVKKSRRHRSLYRSLGPSLKNDKELIKASIKHNISDLEYVSEQLRDDEELIRFAVQLNGEGLKYASKRLRDNKEIVLLAVKQSRFAVKFASWRLRWDIDVIRIVNPR